VGRENKREIDGGAWRSTDMALAAVTSHKSMQMLKRYTHLRAEDLARRLA